jgi:hypothetical protein
MALGTRYPYGRRSDSGADEREIGSGGPVKAGSNYESTSPGSSAGTEVPWSVFSPSMASFLKRTANASFVPRLLSIAPSGLNIGNLGTSELPVPIRFNFLFADDSGVGRRDQQGRVRRRVGEVTLSWRPSLGDLAAPRFLLVLSSRSKYEVFRGAKCHEQLRCESSIATGVVPWSA